MDPSIFLNPAPAPTPLLYDSPAADPFPRAYSAPTLYELPNPLGITSAEAFLGKLFDALLMLAVPVVLAMVLWGAFQIITAAGRSEAVARGGKTILWAAAGFGLLLIGRGAAMILQSLFI
jgi:hypothetical protein